MATPRRMAARPACWERPRGPSPRALGPACVLREGIRVLASPVTTSRTRAQRAQRHPLRPQMRYPEDLGPIARLQGCLAAGRPLDQRTREFQSRGTPVMVSKTTSGRKKRGPAPYIGQVGKRGRSPLRTLGRTWFLVPPSGPPPARLRRGFSWRGGLAYTVSQPTGCPEKGFPP